MKEERNWAEIPDGLPEDPKSTKFFNTLRAGIPDEPYRRELEERKLV